MCVNLPYMTHARHGHSLIFLPLAMGGGHVYALGELEDSSITYSESVECLFFGASGDPPENSTWKEISPLNIGRAFFGAVVHRCGILIAGGIGVGGAELDTVEVFKRTKIDETGQWSLLSYRMVTAGPVAALIVSRVGIISFGKLTHTQPYMPLFTQRKENLGRGGGSMWST